MQGLETSGAVAVIFEEITVDVRLIEHRARDALIATLRHPHAPEIAAAGVDGDRHALGCASGDRVDDARIIPRELIGIEPVRANAITDRAVAEEGEADLVELHITASGL